MLKRVNNILSQKSLADEIGFSVGKINYVLKALVDKGFIKAERFLNSDNKTKYKYLLTDEGLNEKIQLTQKFIARKKDEYEELQKDLVTDMLKCGGQIK
jgi:EPS-associated MarR family transcriptional regulator